MITSRTPCFCVALLIAAFAASAGAEDPPAPDKAKPVTHRTAKAKPEATAPAHDRLELDATAVTGSRELPKVLVIVPWKKADLGDLAGKPLNSLVDEALQPLDREVFRREVDYHRALTPDRASNPP